MKKEKLYIGIDPGIVSGFAGWFPQSKEFDVITSLKIYELFRKIEVRQSTFDLHVFIENPNSWFGFRGQAQDPNRLQGAGAVKQTFKHITEYLTDHNIPFTPTKLQGNMKKVKADYFKKLTGYTLKTNEHSRDASLIVFNK